MSVTLLSVLLCATVAEPEPMGRVVVAEGDPEVRAEEADAWTPIRLGDTLFVGQRLRTDSDDRLRVLMNNRSLLDVAPASELRLSFIAGEGPKRRVGVRAFLGRLWARVAKGEGEDRFEIRTDDAVAGVRGTSFFLEVREAGETSVTVSAGEVELAGAAFEPVKLGENMRGTWKRGAVPRIDRNIAGSTIARLTRSTAPAPRLRAKAAKRRIGALARRFGGKGMLKKKLGPRLKKLSKAQRRKAFQKLMDIDPTLARRLLERLKRLRQEGP